MRRPRGVRSRLTLSTALITAAAMAAMLVVILIAANRLAASEVETSLDGRITAVEDALRADGRLVAAPRTGDDEILDSVWVFDAAGREVSGPEAGDRITDEVARLSDVGTATTVHRGDRIFRARPIAVPSDRSVRGVAVATGSLEIYEGSRDILVGALGVAALLVIAGTAAITAWTVTRTLRPVAEMTEAADEWSASDLDTRFDPSGDDELSRLGRTFNGLLDRVAHAIRTEQQLTGELAHELRTPLTAIRGDAELAVLSDPDGPASERFTRIVEQVDRLSATISTLLDLARHAPASGRRADVGEVVAALVGARPRTAVQLDVVAAAGLHVAAAPELVDRVVGPVVDNAVRHAATSVEIVVRRREGHVVVDVSDDGGGIDESDVEAVFGAGFRRADDPDGAGLGLALARRVATSMGGTVSVTSRHAPTVVTIALPEV